VHRRKRRRYEHPDVLALSTQRFREREAAAERVAVGVFVTEDQDLLVRVDELLDLVVDMQFVVFDGRYRFCSSGSPLLCGSTSFSSSEMWTLYSIDGSSSKRKSGENFRFWRRRPSSCRIRPLADTRPLIDAFCSSGLPSTLTRTRAWRRSGDMRTAGMLTNPIRGSFRSRRMMDRISSRTCAPT